MNLIIENMSSEPLYGQIARQIREAILSGKLHSGEPLPSIRHLAKELQVSIITTKRAYEELEREGFIETVPGKGCFVAGKNTEFLREEKLRLVEASLMKAAEEAKSCGIPLAELQQILAIIYGDE